MQLSLVKKNGAWRQGIRLFREMTSEKIVPNAKAYTVVISVCGNARQWKQAVDLHNEMPKNGVLQDIPSFHAVIIACLKSGRGNEALKLFGRTEN